MSRRTQDPTKSFNQFRLRGFHSLQRCFPTASTINLTLCRGPTTPHCCGLGCSPFARRYLGNHYCFLFLLVLRCFSSQGLPCSRLCIHLGITYLCKLGFPIRIPLTMSVILSSRLFADYRVLLRLQVSRHSPYALSSLTFLIT